MARPIKCRKVDFLPDARYFLPSKEIPSDRDADNIREIILKIEELEAMRLRDIEGLTQQECADKMGISRQTFQNIIDNGRKKLTLALMEGRAIYIKGGNYTFSFCELRCKTCNKSYDINYIRDKKICPSCSSRKVVCKGKNERCKDWCTK